MGIYAFIIISEPLESTHKMASVDHEKRMLNQNPPYQNDVIIHDGMAYEKIHEYPMDTHYIDLANNKSKHFILNEKFMIASSLWYAEADYNGVSIEFWAFYHINGSYYYEYVPLDYCRPDMFPEEIIDELTEKGIFDWFYCPDFKNFEMISYYYGNTEYTYFEVDYVQCLDWDDYNGCWDPQEIYGYYNGARARTVWVEQYLDTQDHEKPIKYRV